MHKQNRILIYILTFSVLLGVGAEIVVGAPMKNLVALGCGGAICLAIINLFQYKQVFTQAIQYIAISSLTSIAFFIITSSDYVTATIQQLEAVLDQQVERMVKLASATRKY